MNLAIPTANIQRRWRHLRVWARHTGLSRKFAVALAIAATVSGFATYGALTRSGPFGPDAESIIILLNIDLVLLLALGVIVARRLVVLWTERRRGSAGSRLHTRLVMMFSLAAIVPAILVGTFSALFFTLGIDAWFSERVKTALDESAAVSQAYLDEHAANVRAQVLAMARDIEYNNGPGLIFDPTRLSLVLERQATLRDLSEAIVFRSDGRLLGKTSLSFSLALDQVPDELLIRAAGGDVVMVTGDNSDRVRALVQLDSVPGVFLYAGRLVDPIVIGHTARVSSAVEEFQLLEVKRGDLQIAFALVYVIAAMLLLFVAIWFAVFMIPYFMWVREPRPAVKQGGFGAAMGDLWESLKQIAQRSSLASFLGSSMLYRDALNALYGFGGVYARLVLDWSLMNIAIFGMKAQTTPRMPVRRPTRQATAPVVKVSPTLDDDTPAGYPPSSPARTLPAPTARIARPAVAVSVRCQSASASFWAPTWAPSESSR